jgi:hypothetical protein
MKIIGKKYLQSASFIILAGYIYLSVFNILHYHIIHINNGVHSFSVQKEENNPSDNFLIKDFTYNCTFHQNYSSLHSIVDLSSSVGVKLLDEPKPLKAAQNSIILLSSYLTSYNLRAPPTFFI